MKAVEQHLVRLQEVGPDDKGAAITQLGMRYLQLGELIVDDGGSIIEAEIHSEKRPKLFRQTEPLLPNNFGG